MGCRKLLVVVFCVFLFQWIPCALSQQASVSPSVLSFAPQVVNLVSPGSQSQTVTLTNTGNSDLIVSSVLARRRLQADQQLLDLLQGAERNKLRTPSCGPGGLFQ
jgi:hypothetical protein